MPGGQRRLANVRKLMRLAREHEAAHGSDLRDFLELVARRARLGRGRGEARESEAPVEGEALDAVRLMTIHRAKGLEFEVVCVADLGRGPRWRAELMRVGRDGRFGLRLGRAGHRPARVGARLQGARRGAPAAEAREERRLFYVAMTRARERLILSGAAKLEVWPELEGPGGGGGPVAWIGPAAGRARRRGGDVRAAGGSRSRRAAPDRSPPDRADRRPKQSDRAAGRCCRSAPDRRRHRRAAHGATGVRAQLHLAGRVPALRLPLLRRAGAPAAGAPGHEGAGAGAESRRARSAPPSAARSSTRCSSGSISAARSSPPRRRSPLRRALRADGRSGRRRRGADHRARGSLRGRRAVPAAWARRPACGARSGSGSCSADGVLIGGVFDVIAREPGGPHPDRRLQDRSARRRRPAGARRSRLRHAAAGLRAGRAEAPAPTRSRSCTRSSSFRSARRSATVRP